MLLVSRLCRRRLLPSSGPAFAGNFVLDRGVVADTRRTLGLGLAGPRATERGRAPFVDKEGFVQVFKFPYAPHCALVARLKVYQTVGLVGGILPFIYYKSLQPGGGEGLAEDLQAALTVGCLAVLVLALLGEAARRLVGVVYLHPQSRRVKFAHLTFFGGRQETVVPLEDIVPVSETREDARSTIWAVQAYEDKLAHKYISTQFGGIKNRKYFAEIFGEEGLSGAVYAKDDDHPPDE